MEGNAYGLDSRKVFEIATSSLKVVSNVQDITITRHTKHLKTYTHHKKKEESTQMAKKEEKTVIIVHDDMIK